MSNRVMAFLTHRVMTMGEKAVIPAQYRKSRSMMRKCLSIGALALLLGGCASLDMPFARTHDADLEAQGIALADQQAKNFELSQLVNELRRDNEQLLKTVESLKAERSRVAALASEAISAESDRIEAARADAQREAILVVPAPPKNPDTIIVAEAEAAPLTSSAVTVESTPRLVQPSFVAAENVFENEATGSSLQTSSLLFGVHLASYRKADDAINAWKNFQRENPNLLGLLEPRIETIEIAGRGKFKRLIAGGFSSEDKAADLCDDLKRKKLYCKVTGFNGERLDIPAAG